ncbi:uncharacterized protein [Diadema antillarum]|uniref:uncharacterized protein n=1 Tax=Diadema antillarum TaxID=105358 RepID=UPI003A8506D6
MGDGLIKNLLAICCFVSCARIALVVIYLGPQSSPPTPVFQLGYSSGSVLRREAPKRQHDRGGSNVSFVGYHDDQAHHEIARKEDDDWRRLEGDSGDHWEVIPAAAVSQNFDLMPAGGCQGSGKDIFLLTLVHSLPPHFAQRQAIRETWARNMSEVNGARVKVIFVTPGVSPRPDVMTGLRKEAAEYDDVIHSVAGDSLISYRPSSKVLLSEMGWTLTYCTGAKFVLFANDELFVNIHHIVERLKLVTPKPFKTFILGRVKKFARVERDTLRWDHVSETVYARETYPNYCVGGAGFVMSVPCMREIHPRAVRFNKRANAFPLSDAMVGIVSNQLNIVPRYHEEFHKSGGEADYCDLRDTLTLGDFSRPELIRGAWRNYTHKMDYCPNPLPNATEVSWWTKGVNHKQYFSEALRLIHEPRSCEGQDISLLALVSTHPHNTNLRSAIRVTWGHPNYIKPLKVRLIFVIGRETVETQKSVQDIEGEAKQFGDILQANFAESFHNLTLKVILGLRWVSEKCPSASFVYKGDDDMLVNFEHMIGYLDQLQTSESKNLFMGNLMSMSPAIRTSSKYQVRREVYPFKYFLPYFSGGGYIMSAAAVQQMAPMAVSTKLIPIDDAYAGILAFRAGVPLKHSGGFIVGGSKRDACRLRRAFNMHGFKKTTVLIGTWKTFKDPSHKCDEDREKKTWSHDV